MTSGHVFRVGDAAGQCLPFTGEGIRPALYFGALVGKLTRRVLEGELRESDALCAYREVDKRQIAITHLLMLAAQKVLPALPMGCLEWIAGQTLRPERLNPLVQIYREMINPTVLSLLWSAQPAGIPFLPAEWAQRDPGILSRRA